MITPCATDLALERLLAGRAPPEVIAHVDACGGCAERLAAMRREGEDFRRTVYPATVERIEDAAARSPGRRFLLALLPAPVLLAAAAAVFLVVRPVGPPDDYLGVKGSGGIGLTVFTPGRDGPRLLADGAEVSSASTLRFRVRVSELCRLVLVSVDGAGTVSRLDGGGALGVPLTAGLHDLPGGVELDGKPGPERLYAVCLADAAAVPAVEAAAREAGGRGGEGVRRTVRLAGLPPTATQTTHLLEKRP